MLTESSIEKLIFALQEARERTLDLVADLNDDQLMGPRLSIVNPLLWEIGHVAWFQEYWVLRHFHRLESLLSQSDRLYDSARVPHDTRWELSLPSRTETLNYMQQVLDQIIEQCRNPSVSQQRDPHSEGYFLYLALFHEYMHAEAFAYTRQTLMYPPPKFSNVAGVARDREAAGTGSTRRPQNGQVLSGHALAPALAPTGGEGAQRAGEGDLSTLNSLVTGGGPSSSETSSVDARIPGGVFLLGSSPGTPFVFDNEQWAHPVEVRAFFMARQAVTNAEFAAFVADGGYSRPELWALEGWDWRERSGAEHPLYWQPLSGGRWSRRHFDQWVALEERLPVLHVNWYEADAYCRWARRRLPAEAEWELAACAELSADGSGIKPEKRHFPWGDDLPTPSHANLDWRGMGCVEVDALPAGDNLFGCRQMIGNTWEWTATDFLPYPGFVPGPYNEYSAPWFGDHKVLRGGCWATRSGLIRGAYRNFYRPDRRDVWAGFRTCAV